MKALRSLSLTVAIALICGCTTPPSAPPPAPVASTAPAMTPTPPVAPKGGRVSPSETVSAKIDGNRVTIVYGRPFSKDPKTGAPRKIWGGLVPYGKVWRTGANEATLLITQKPIDLGGTVIPAGAYSLWTQPEEDGRAALIVNKQIGHWGTEYDASQDLARVPLKKEPLETPVDQFTITIGKAPSGGGGVIKLMWETTQYSVGYNVAK
jgi:hypothetical protein